MRWQLIPFLFKWATGVWHGDGQGEEEEVGEIDRSIYRRVLANWYKFLRSLEISKILAIVCVLHRQNPFVT